MRRLICACLVLGLAVSVATAADPVKAPTIVLQSPDGKKSYDLAKLTADGPVLVRLTCACTGCDKELVHFQKLQASYNDKGLKTLAIFREKPESLEQYVAKKGIQFLWLCDADGGMWKSFDAKVMPTNILIEKGGKIAKIVPGCAPDGKNAQVLSGEIAKLLKTNEVKIVEPAKKEEPKKVEVKPADKK